MLEIDLWNVDHLLQPVQQCISSCLYNPNELVKKYLAKPEVKDESDSCSIMITFATNEASASHCSLKKSLFLFHLKEEGRKREEIFKNGRDWEWNSVERETGPVEVVRIKGKNEDKRNEKNEECEREGLTR